MPTPPFDRLRGLKHRAVHESGRRLNNLEAWYYDRRRRVETRGKATMSEMGVSGPLADHGTGFQSVNEGHLRRVFDEMAFPLESGFVDIGSGKGKPLIIAAEYGFHPVVGVELVESLCAVARANIERLGLAEKVRVECTNGVDYSFGRERVVFLNNPFDAEFLSTMVRRLTEAMAGSDRPAWVLYGNPTWRHVFEDHPNWAERRYFSFRGPGRDIAVYEYVSAA